ncbi:MAG: hypothetical protein AAB268_11815 [Elusimicrobiota bacterium]
MKFCLSAISFLFIASSGYAQCPPIGPTPTTLRIRTTHFLICEDTTTSAASSDYITEVSTTAEEVWTFVVISSGFRNPPGTVAISTADTQRIPIVIEGRGVGDFGSTNAATPPRIRIDDDYASADGWTTSGSDGLRTTLVHEFLHAAQQAYVNPTTVWQPTTMNWVWEGTGAWIEDEFPQTDSINTYLDSHEGYARLFWDSPEISLDQRVGGPVHYGPMLFYKYLTEHGISIRQLV